MTQADKKILEKLAAETGESRATVLHMALDQLKRKIFFEKMNGGYAAMRKDASLWQVELVERALFDNAACD